MSPRDCSFFFAGVLVTVAVTMLVLRPWDSTPSASSITATASAAPATAHASTSGDNAGSLDEVTQKLSARLSTTGGSDSEWALLAQSYDYMGRTADAAAARSHIANAPVATGASTAPSSPALDSQTLATVSNALDK